MKFIKTLILSLALLTTMTVHAADCNFRQSTASQEMLIGPFLDSTDGNTPETALTIANTDIRLSPAAGNIVAKNSGGGTHDELGLYQITLDATDTATVGSLDIAIAETGALIVWHKCWVYEENVYDEIFAANADLGTDVAAILVDTSTTLDDFLDTEIAAILVDTAEIGTAGAGLTGVPWNAAWDAEVESEATDALVADGLDHLVSAAVVGADITDNSIVARLTSSSATADWDSFVNTTDSLQAVRDRGDAAWITGAGGSDPFVLQNTTIATLASQVSFTLTAGSADNSAYVGMLAIVEDSATATQKGVGVISAYTGATRTVTLREDPAVFTMAIGDTIDIVAVSPDVLNILADTGEIGAAGAGLTAVPWNSSWDVEVESEAADALVADGLDHLVSAAVTGTDIVDDSIIAQLVGDDATADWDTFDNTTDSLEALRLRGDAAWVTGSGGTGMTALANDTAQAGTASTIQLAAAETFADDDLNGNIVCIDSGTGDGQCRVISDYALATDTATVEPDWTTNPDATSTYEVWPGSVNVSVWDGADITSALETSTDIADAVRDRACGTPSAGTLGEQICTDVDAILVDTSTTLDDFIDTEVAAILADTGTDGVVIGADAITAATIAANAIGASELATDAIGALEIAADAIGASEIATAAITNAEVSIDGSELTAIPWNAAWDAEVESEVDDSIGGGTGTALTAIPWNASWDVEVESEANDALVALNLDDLALQVLFVGTCDSGSTTTCVDAALTQADDYWKGVGIVFTSGTVSGQTSCVFDFTAATDTLLFRARTAAIATNDFMLFASPLCEGVVSP